MLRSPFYGAATFFAISIAFFRTVALLVHNIVWFHKVFLRAAIWEREWYNSVERRNEERNGEREKTNDWPSPCGDMRTITFCHLNGISTFHNAVVLDIHTPLSSTFRVLENDINTIFRHVKMVGAWSVLAKFDHFLLSERRFFLSFHLLSLSLLLARFAVFLYYCHDVLTSTSLHRKG